MLFRGYGALVNWAGSEVLGVKVMDLYIVA